MRILIIHQYFLEENEPGGSRWNEMTRSWYEAGHDIVVIAGMMHSNGTEKYEKYKGVYFMLNIQNNIKVWRCHVSGSYNKNFTGRLWGYFSFMFSSIWAGIFKVKGKYDLILVTSPPLFVGISGYVISRLKRIPMVFEIRDLWPESAIDTGVLKNKLIIKLSYWVESFLYRKSTLINVLTPAFYNILRDKKKVNENKLILIPNAADFSMTDKLFENFDRDLFRSQNDLSEYFVIIYVGAHGVANHLEQLLSAAEVLKDTNVLFLLIGQGMEKDKLVQSAKQGELLNVRFLDPIPKKDIFKYIFASEMGISVLKNVETFKTVYSNKTFDYMACKKPILMAIDGVSRKLVEDASAGSYIEPENIASFNTVIRGYLGNENLLATQGNSGYNYAKTHFDRTYLASKYLGYLEEIVNR